jgi:hypothetical protein
VLLLLLIWCLYCASTVRGLTLTAWPSAGPYLAMTSAAAGMIVAQLHPLLVA